MKVNRGIQNSMPNGQKQTRYKAQVKLEGVWKTKTFDTRREAKAWIEQQEKPHTPTLKAAIERYVLRYLDLTKDGHRTRKRHLEWWLERLGDISLTDINKHRVLRERDTLLAKVTPSTANRYQAALSALLSITVNEWGLLEHNPLLGAKMLRENPARVRYLSEKEISTVLALAKTSYQPALYPYIMIALTTGMRKGEIANLTWGDINLEQDLILIRKAKNHQARSVPVLKPAKEAIIAWRENNAVKDLGQYVFPGRGKAPLDIRKAWEDLRKRANIPDVRFHDLRHTTASWCAMRGVDVRTIAELLGHKSLAMTYRYSHLNAGRVREGAERALQGWRAQYQG